jgi:hypothetical protein
MVIQLASPLVSPTVSPSVSYVGHSVPPSVSHPVQPSTVGHSVPPSVSHPVPSTVDRCLSFQNKFSQIKIRMLNSLTIPIQMLRTGKGYTLIDRGTRIKV